METYTLKRAIKDVSGENEIKEVQVKEEADLNASDFYEVLAYPTGENLADAVANVCGLTSMQVASMSIKDYRVLAGKVGKFLEE